MVLGRFPALGVRPGHLVFFELVDCLLFLTDSSPFSDEDLLLSADDLVVAGNQAGLGLLKGICGMGVGYAIQR